MKYDKIMARGDLDNIMDRLNGCRALLYLLYECSGADAVPGNAISGVCDLLDCICRDFQANIDSAEDYTGESAEAEAPFNEKTSAWPEPPGIKKAAQGRKEGEAYI